MIIPALIYGTQPQIKDLIINICPLTLCKPGTPILTPSLLTRYQVWMYKVPVVCVCRPQQSIGTVRHPFQRKVYRQDIRTPHLMYRPSIHNIHILYILHRVHIHYYTNGLLSSWYDVTPSSSITVYTETCSLPDSKWWS